MLSDWTSLLYSQFTPSSQHSAYGGIIKIKVSQRFSNIIWSDKSCLIWIFLNLLKLNVFIYFQHLQGWLLAGSCSDVLSSQSSVGPPSAPRFSTVTSTGLYSLILWAKINRVEISRSPGSQSVILNIIITTSKSFSCTVCIEKMYIIALKKEMH